jgi:hypothetical protein
MSDTEIRHREGMPYGGLPHAALLSKLEETDPALLPGSADGAYERYLRGEIIDRTLDAPYLESDQARRDPALSRGLLNLRYNGTRGSNPELPRHPEMFYGFMGDDPRGVVNDPRLDEVRGHMAARAAGLTARMGNNDHYHLAERPWTGQAISYAMKEVHRRQKANTRIFTTSKEGRVQGRQTAFDEYAAGDLRAAAMGAGGESIGGGARFVAGDYAPAREAAADGVRGVDGGHGADSAPWRHTTGDGDLGVQRYGQERGAGRAAGLGASHRGAASGADQAWGDAARARSTNRQSLAATMAVAARHRAAARSGAHDQDATASHVAAGGLGAGLVPAQDVAALYRRTAEDQTRRPAGEVQDGAGGVLGGAAGLAPAAHPERALRAAIAQTTSNDYLTDVGHTAVGLREATAAARRRVAGATVADSARHLATSEGSGGAKQGLLPRDGARAHRLASAPLVRAAAAEGLVVHNYRGAPPPRPEPRAERGREAYDAATWRGSREALPLGAGKAPEWRSQTQAQTSIGDEPGRVFGFDAEVDGFHGATPMGPKSLRAGGWSDSAQLTDELGGFGGA